VIGDNARDHPRWKNIRNNSVTYAEAFNAAGGSPDLMDLPDIGIKGNPRMMMDKNSDQIAGLIRPGEEGPEQLTDGWAGPHAPPPWSSLFSRSCNCVALATVCAAIRSGGRARDRAAVLQRSEARRGLAPSLSFRHVRARILVRARSTLSVTLSGAGAMKRRPALGCP
jgi:hypothetical protein